jgi:hypothetical protein
MDQRVIVIEQRLRSGGLVLAIAGVMAIFFIVAIFLSGTVNKGLIPTTSLVVLVVVFVGLSAALLLFNRIIVRVVDTPKGRSLEIVYGPGGLVRQVFSSENLVSAVARNLSFMQMGGYGYRGSVKILRRAALVTRQGDALEVQLAGKRRFIVTVDQPADFVTALDLPTAQ